MIFFEKFSSTLIELFDSIQVMKLQKNKGIISSNSKGDIMRITKRKLGYVAGLFPTIDVRATISLKSKSTPFT